MKLQKLIISAATTCLLVGASGGAMARNDCPPSGFLVGETVEEFVIDEDVGTSCTVVSTQVNGDVLVSSGSGGFIMKASIVNGNVQVSDTLVVSLVDNQVLRPANVDSGGNLAVGSTGDALVVNNIVSGGGNLQVIDSISGTCLHEASVFVMANLVQNGNLEVACNRTATVRQNTVTNGDISCSDNIELDSVDNQSQGGTVSCSRAFEEQPDE